MTVEYKQVRVCESCCRHIENQRNYKQLFNTSENRYTNTLLWGYEVVLPHKFSCMSCVYDANKNHKLSCYPHNHIWLRKHIKENVYMCAKCFSNHIETLLKWIAGGIM